MGGMFDNTLDISIHALLAESDKIATAFIDFLAEFLSTLSLRRATFRVRYPASSLLISIHALLAESDLFGTRTLTTWQNFYPRSPCGERHWRIR